MAIRMPLINHARKILRRSSFAANRVASKSAVDVPKGHIAIFVGEQERKRLVIPVSFLNHPSFQDFLIQAEEDFGFNHPMGALTIPCREDIFEDLTSRLIRS